MRYFVSPDAYGDVFVVPARVADEKLLLASGLQLKVLLLFLREKAADESAFGSLADRVGTSIGEFKDALDFWVGEGVLGREASAAVAGVTPPKRSAPAEQPAKATAAPAVPASGSRRSFGDAPKLSATQIAARIEEDESIATLLKESQSTLGRTIGPADQGVLINLHDFYGLPVELIMTICGYAVNAKKGSDTKYIWELGKEWAQQGITNLTDAATYLEQEEKIDAFWAALDVKTGGVVGSLKRNNRPAVRRWLFDMAFSDEMIFLAFTVTEKHTQKFGFAYMNRVLERWFAQGLKTPAQVVAREEDSNSAQSGSQTAAADPSAASAAGESYDIAAAQRKARAGVPVYRKKKKN